MLLAKIFLRPLPIGNVAFIIYWVVISANYACCNCAACLSDLVASCTSLSSKLHVQVAATSRTDTDAQIYCRMLPKVNVAAAQVCVVCCCRTRWVMAQKPSGNLINTSNRIIAHHLATRSAAMTTSTYQRYQLNACKPISSLWPLNFSFWWEKALDKINMFIIQ